MRKKILVVDDDQDIMEAIQFTLETNGYQVKTSDRGDNVDRLYENKESLPDLIILDVLLSGKDGKVICKQLKSNDETKNIPVIMISAHPSAEKVIKEAGADDFLAKPFEVNGLLEIVTRNLKKKVLN